MNDRGTSPQSASLADLRSGLFVRPHPNPASSSNDSAPETTVCQEPVSSYPLSFAQERIWFWDQVEPNSPLYNLPVAMRVRGDLDVDALRKSLDLIVARHEALRTTFVSEAGRP